MAIKKNNADNSKKEVLKEGYRPPPAPPKDKPKPKEQKK